MHLPLNFVSLTRSRKFWWTQKMFLWHSIVMKSFLLDDELHEIMFPLSLEMYCSLTDSWILETFSRVLSSENLVRVRIHSAHEISFSLPSWMQNKKWQIPNYGQWKLKKMFTWIVSLDFLSIFLKYDAVLGAMQ